MEKIIAGLFGLLMGMGGGLAGFIQLRNLAATGSWKTAKGKVLERGTFRVTQANLSAPAFQHSPLVKYRYKVGGREFVNDSILP